MPPGVQPLNRKGARGASRVGGGSGDPGPQQQEQPPVLDGQKVAGVVTRDGLLKALAQKDDAAVSEIMRRDVAIADASDMLENALQRLQESGCNTLLVLQNQNLVGLLTAENLGEFLMIKNARNGRSIAAAQVIQSSV